MFVAPVIGWVWAKRICEPYRQGPARPLGEPALRRRRAAPRSPRPCPQTPARPRAERSAPGLAKLAAEQQSNSVFYAGPKGILGMGTRWGSWQLAEELIPREAGKEIHPLPQLGRHPADPRPAPHAGARPAAHRRLPHPLGTALDRLPDRRGRQGGRTARRRGGRGLTDQEPRDAADLQRAAVRQRQPALSGRPVRALGRPVGDHHADHRHRAARTLRIEVTGHALGPVHALFTSGPQAKTKEVDKRVKFWETPEVKLPLVESRARWSAWPCAHRCTWFPPLLDYFGGKLTLPEPFGLRHAWAEKPWRHRFMADDAMRAATPVLRVVHSAAMKVLEENGVNAESSTTARDPERTRPGPDAAAGRRLRRLSWACGHPERLRPRRRSTRRATPARPRPASSGCRPAAAAAPGCARRPA